MYGFFNGLSEVLVPLGICVVLPVLIVWMVIRKRMNQDNIRKEIILSALEKNAEIDVEELMSKMNAPSKSRLLKEKLLTKLLIGSMLLIFGAFTIIATFLLLFYTEANKEIFIPCTLIGVPSTAVGIAFLINYFVGKRTLKKELEAESNATVIEQN